MKKIILTILTIAPFILSAQTLSDIYSYSSTKYQGTAKSLAMGNAMGAVGQDFSAIEINPAGLALFRKPTFTITTGLSCSKTTSSYKQSEEWDYNLRTPVNNLGYVWISNVTGENLYSLNFSLGLNKKNNFSYCSYTKGQNYSTSLIDSYINELDANGIHSSQDLLWFSPNNIFPLYDTYLLNFETGNGYSSPVPQGGLIQQRGVLSRGFINELSFSTGANFRDKVFVGASIGVPLLYRSLLTEYQENDLDNNNDFKEWEQRESLYTDGCGINAKFGVIVFPAKWVRLGLSLTTPTSYYIDESWRTSTYADFKTGRYSYQTETSYYSYYVVTPMLLNASAAFIFGNFGMITADYEYVNYSKMKVSSPNYDYSYMNGDIRHTFSPTSNIRIGTEWRVKRMCFRGGYSVYGSPYGFSKRDMRTDTYSIGLGYTFRFVTIDAAYALSNMKNTYDLYSAYSIYPAYSSDGSIDNTEVKETTNINQLIVSLKIRLD
ncbi:MAG: hypothetical protein ACI358_07820 [Candidatus Limimorpha sp.]